MNLRDALQEACDLADEANGDPSSCSHVVPLGLRVAELRAFAGNTPAAPAIMKLDGVDVVEVAPGVYKGVEELGLFIAHLTQLRVALGAPADPTTAEITHWVKELARRCKIEVMTFKDGTTGMINVPAKYVAMIDQMHVAWASSMLGEGLPEFLPEPPPKPKVTGRKRKK